LITQVEEKSVELRQLLAAGIVTAAFPGAVALAQAAAPAVAAAAVTAAADELVELEAITVTARRRDEEW
jgi:hypothetical protein